MAHALLRLLLGERTARRAILEALYAAPDDWVHLRELARRTGFSAPMVAKEAERLLDGRVIKQKRAPNARLFRANAESPLGRQVSALLSGGRNPPRPTKGPAARPRPVKADGRPTTLAQAAELGRETQRRDAMIREFCDEFYKAATPARSAMIAAEPSLQGAQADAYYAAIAEHLALQSGIPIPRWAIAAERFRSKPFFPAGLESLKSTLIVESPVAFRRRMIFVGANPLSRPARTTP